MKSQTQHIGNYSNVFDYSPFGAPLDGRTVKNIFHQEEITDTSTVLKTIYVLEETFDVASDWQAVTSYSQISYPSGKMRGRNSASNKQVVGARKSFVTGDGLHQVSFDITSLPSFICEYQPPFPPIGIGINSDSTTTSGIGGNATLNVVVKNQNNGIITSGSYNTTGTFTNLNFTAVEGDTYTIEFYINNVCKNTFFQVDNVFISHKEEVNIETGNFIVSGGYRYGYQGSEKTDELKGSGNHYTTFFRELDPRLGRWWSVDPKANAQESPYVSMSNSPIMFNDPLGDTTKILNSKGDLLVQINDEGGNRYFETDDVEGFNDFTKKAVELSKEGKLLDNLDDLLKETDFSELVIKGDISDAYTQPQKLMAESGYQDGVSGKSKSNSSKMIMVNPDERSQYQAYVFSYNRGKSDYETKNKLSRSNSQKPILTLSNDLIIIKNNNTFIKYKKNQEGNWEQTNYVGYPIEERTMPSGTIPYNKD